MVRMSLSITFAVNNTHRIRNVKLNVSVSAAWKIVKSWLGPEAISKLKFASRSEIQGFIGLEYLPAHMGGTVCIMPLFE